MAFRMNLLDLCTGIGGFDLAARLNGYIDTICTAEIDPYNVKLIERNLNLPNAGDINNICIQDEDHPHYDLVNQDLVPVEETGFTSLLMSDFLDGVVDYPHIVSFGFPCQDLSSSNHEGLGLNGNKSGLVFRLLEIVENLEPNYVVIENVEPLLRDGLNLLLILLNKMGYVVEWSVMAACHFGFPHYRHRVFICAYQPHTAIGRSNGRVFDIAKRRANKQPNHYMPYISDEPDLIKKLAVVEEPKSIKLRTKRLAGIGNAVMPVLAKCIFDAITTAEKKSPTPELYDLSKKVESKVAAKKTEKFFADLLEDDTWWNESQLDFFATNKDQQDITTMPSSGIMIGNKIYSSGANRKLNPKKTTYDKLLFSTPTVKSDANNNFSPSRLKRKGRLGGIVGDLMHNLDVPMGGGLRPEFSEVLMSFPKGYTELR